MWSPFAFLEGLQIMSENVRLPHTSDQDLLPLLSSFFLSIFLLYVSHYTDESANFPPLPPLRDHHTDLSSFSTHPNTWKQCLTLTIVSLEKSENKPIFRNLNKNQSFFKLFTVSSTLLAISDYQSYLLQLKKVTSFKLPKADNTCKTSS